MSETPGRLKPAVLVVEDEVLIRLSGVATAEAAGFQAIGVSNADEALSVLEARDDIAAVFTDVQIPGSMDGLGLIRLVRDRWPTVGLVVASGKSI
jgi:two-component system, response regulator PdtaR